ncbi:hypothetical protein FM107_03970 [Sphingobacterium sp. JB170]|nr:hypothetical protein FM107_03970 [Sphingobacterium sp. JB170]
MSWCAMFCHTPNSVGGFKTVWFNHTPVKVPIEAIEGGFSFG